MPFLPRRYQLTLLSVLSCLVPVGVGCGSDSSTSNTQADASFKEMGPEDMAPSIDKGRRVDATQDRNDSGGQGAQDLGASDMLTSNLDSCQSVVDQKGWELCSEQGDICHVKFTDRIGCAAVCEALGRTCVFSFEDNDAQCSANMTLPALECADTGHISDYCVCGPGKTPPKMPPMPQGTEDSFKAFPQAEGFGAQALTSCDRSKLRVVEVTQLGNEGPGSLREALGAKSGDDSYRLVIFRVGGTIEVTRPLRLEHSCLYVAGQTAPGDGIQVRFAQGARVVNLIQGGTTQALKDVVFRYMRLRSGRGPSGSGDNLSIRAGERIVLDHLSGAYGNDECFSASTGTTASGSLPLQNVTLQHNLIGAPLYNSAVGSIIGRLGRDDVSAEATGFSVHHNFYAHMKHRNPLLQGAGASQVINNVVYNWNSRVSRIHGDTQAEVVSNVMKPGPRNPRPASSSFYLFDGNGTPKVYFEDNQAVGIGPVGWGNYYNDKDREFVQREAFELSTRPTPPVPVTTSPASQVEELVLADVGANATLGCDGSWIKFQDALDQRLIKAYRDATGPTETPSTYDDIDDYGGFPQLNPGQACADQDKDGMPDLFETKYGLDPMNPSDALVDSDGDGYVNVEEFVNGTLPKKLASQ